MSTPARAAIVTIALVAAVGALAVWRSMGTSSVGCSGEVRLSVAAAPEIAPVLSQAASRWAAGARGDGGECVKVDVAAVAPADVALSIANSGGVVLSGLTPLTPSSASPAATASPTVRQPVAIPDVWVPDSSTWLLRVRAAGPELVPPQTQTIATSPVVLAMPEPDAKLLGWPNQTPTWSTLLALLTSGQPVHLGIVEPNRNAVGLSSLVALGGAAAATGANADSTTVAVMKALFGGRFQAESDMLAGFPKSADPAALAAGLSAAPMSERSLIAFNATNPPVKLAALYVTPAPPALDYPYAVMPGIAADRVRLADDLRAALSGDQFLHDLAAAGLRGPDGTAGFPALPGSPLQISGNGLDGAAIAKALGTWISVTRPARMLAVFDVSGSMADPVPTAGGATRAQVALAAAKAGMALFDDSWSVGLWEFSADMGGGKDYKQLLPIAPMSQNRPGLLAAIGTIQPIPNGNTGLYDTVLDAYKAVQDGFDPNAVNSVVLLTDGQNDDDDGMTQDQLISSLKAIMDPRYPVEVIAIGISTDASQAELQAITNTTGGGTFIAADPSQIGAIFLKALSLRPEVPLA
jgi:hypothetical protein